MHFQQYTLTITEILSRCCCHLAWFPQDDDAESIYGDYTTQLLRDFPSLWQLLWTHRYHLFEPRTGVSDERCDRFGGAVAALFKEVYAIENSLYEYVPLISSQTWVILRLSTNFLSRSTSKRAPASAGAVELLLFFWQYHKNDFVGILTMNQITDIMMSMNPSDFKPDISKVITDGATARRIHNQICRHLRNRHVLDVDSASMFILVNLLRSESSLFRQYRNHKGDYFKSIAIALQRQCCSGEDSEVFLDLMVGGFQAIG